MLWTRPSLHLLRIRHVVRRMTATVDSTGQIMPLLYDTLTAVSEIAERGDRNVPQP